MLSLLGLMTGAYLNEEETEKAFAFCEYLQDAGLLKNEIEVLYQNKWLSLYADIPITCWDKSLLKPYTYYYHHELRTQSPPVIFDAKTGKMLETVYYSEMKIMLTAEDVIDYMYEVLHTLLDFQHRKRDIEGLRHILDKHYNVHIGQLTLQTIDVIYTMIDKAQKSSYANRLSFIELYNMFFNQTLLAIEEMCIPPQNKFMLRTGEWVACRGK